MTNNVNKKKRNENAIKNPGAAVIIFNYKHRLGTPGLSEKQAHEIDQLILNTVSLKSVSTSKSKSQPAGRFEMKLAPTKNWVTSISPGSWCVILMAQTKITSGDTKITSRSVGTGRENKVKMIGRIESVRAVSAVDQATGAITTEYVASGEDWGGMLNTVLYVDPLIRGQTDNKDPIAMAERMIYNSEIISHGSTKTPLPSSSDNIKTLLSFWGRTSAARSNFKKEFLNQGRVAESKNKFRLPDELHKYFGFTDASGAPSGNVADILKVISGKLKSKDTGNSGAYEEIDDGASPIMFDTLLGMNSFWQLIMNNSNHWINDTYADLRWENGKAQLAIYNRVKPFAIKNTRELTALAQSEVRANQNQSIIPESLSDLVSPFKNIRTHNIARPDILMVNVGTNWRDRYNFIEVNIKTQMLAGAPKNDSFDAETKLKNQTFDEVAIGRDGFKPMIINAKYIPKTLEGKLDPFRILDYKVMNREWFFNIHRTFNGSLTLIGQDKYIAVGDNIMVDADAIFPGRNANEDHIKNRGRAFFLAHVESISHNASVNPNGGRTFITEIQFVRGAIVNRNGNELGKDVFVDEDTSRVTPRQELNANRSFGTSSGKDGKADPDFQKLKGK